MIKIDKFRHRIQKICRDLSLQRLDIVGSAAREDFSADSDVDVLVNFGNDEGLFGRYFDLKERLEEIFERPVDVIDERAIKNPYFKRAVEKNRVKIYGT
ncbi:MAG: nucleotidyltransferase family protein [Pyrinomonadaceae bacterium]